MTVLEMALVDVAKEIVITFKHCWIKNLDLALLTSHMKHMLLFLLPPQNYELFSAQITAVEDNNLTCPVSVLK